MVGVERSRDQTKMAERLNGKEKLPQTLALKQETLYRNSASKTFSCFESISD